MHCLIRLVHRRKKKGSHNFIMWMLELFMDLDKLTAGSEDLKKLCCYSNIPETMLSNNYQNISLKFKEPAKRVVREKYVNDRVQIKWSSRYCQCGCFCWWNIGRVKVSHPLMDLQQPYLLIVGRLYLKVVKAVRKCKRKRQ